MMQSTVSHTTFSDRFPFLHRRNPMMRLLNWLAERDRIRREMSALSDLPDERLYDMGISRDDLNGQFNRRFGDARWTPRDPSGW